MCGFERTGEVAVRKLGAEPDEVVHAFDQSVVMHLGSPDGFSIKLAAEAKARHWQAAPDRSVSHPSEGWFGRWRNLDLEYR